MNALTRATLKAVPRATVPRRMASSSSSFSMESLRNNIWLSDPGAYPIMAILALACTGCTAYGSYNLFCSPDVRISPSKRESIVRTWGGK
eukprot:CAMPEP_0116565308 /NCGR_PEP_ID=MMETSP0397-20121206/13825_1 /TAXON_ID=216820 /ORGANISM="Cyclophora tenuis, Strain ECT3854" /LENGTH=89 /DNA_ID=CAMNT_0004092065 /DNA_START=1 /DNA_END=270 /DNA_ORIENTATION=-